jgi:hypothetical protein
VNLGLQSGSGFSKIMNLGLRAGILAFCVEARAAARSLMDRIRIIDACGV